MPTVSAFLSSLPLVHAQSHPTQRVVSQTVCTAVPRTTRECAQSFLTQRAVQQIVFYSYTLRDETTGRWLENFLGHSNLYDLHVCNALHLSSTDYLTRLFQAPPEVFHIRKPIQGRTNSKNPYIKRRYFSYDVEVIPRNIAQRVLGARLQIADELRDDLACIPAENERRLRQHRRLVLTKDASANQDLPTAGDRGGSPYRTATFDLAKNYTLFLALRGAIRRMGLADGKWVTALTESQSENLLRPKNGEQGVADKVIGEVLGSTPTVNPRGTFFDPVALAEQILVERSSCAQVWMDVMDGIRDEHLELEKRILEADF